MQCPLCGEALTYGTLVRKRDGEVKEIWVCSWCKEKIGISYNLTERLNKEVTK